MTSIENILDIEDALVTDENPGSGDCEFDVGRCARLFNYLVTVGWMAAEEKGLEDLGELLQKPRFFDESRSAQTQGLREGLDPQLVEFLESIIVPQTGLFYWVNGLLDSSMLADQRLYLEEDDLEDLQVDGRPRFVELCRSVSRWGSHLSGLTYDQVGHRFALPFYIEHHEHILPVNDNLHHWYPLEEILSNWINLLRVGKVVAESERQQQENGSYLLGTCNSVWRWVSYSETQVDRTVEAFNDLVAEIEKRMDPESLLPLDPQKPLLTDGDLDAAGVPERCFIRSFLTRVKTPRFTRIAPGLEVPHDAAAFAARQKLTPAPLLNPEGEEGELIPPVLIFSCSDASRTVPMGLENGGENPWPTVLASPLDQGRGPIPAGLYSEAVDRHQGDIAEEGFRLLLPFAQEGKALLSDLTEVKATASVSGLFQQGFWPFGSGGKSRARRLETLLLFWEQMVVQDDWTVGPNGVEGTIDEFNIDARTMDVYYIPSEIDS